MAHSHADPEVGPHGRAPGVLIRWPRRYDLLVTAGLAGRGGRLRGQIADTLGLRPGQRVLDVGCGTGTLALTLARRVDPDGSIAGVDASREMIAVAQAMGVDFSPSILTINHGHTIGSNATLKACLPRWGRRTRGSSRSTGC
jgi:SAM-dependent methyltransferase